jgi:hypothetical protein
MDVDAQKPHRKSTPGKLNDIVRQKLILAFREGADVGTAAASVQVSRTAVANLIARDEAFAAEVQDAKDIADEKVVSRLYLKALEGDNVAMIFWLKNRRPKEWRDRHDLFVASGPNAFDTDNPRVEIAVVEGAPLSPVRA